MDMTHPMDITPISILVGGKPTLATAAVDFPAPGGGRRLVSLIELVDCWEHDHAIQPILDLGRKVGVDQVTKPATVMIGGMATQAVITVDLDGPDGRRRAVPLDELVAAFQEFRAFHAEHDDDLGPITRLLETEPLKLGRLVFDVPPDTTIAITTRGRHD
jgi:hypothetical protein